MHDIIPSDFQPLIIKSQLVCVRRRSDAPSPVRLKHLMIVLSPSSVRIWDFLISFLPSFLLFIVKSRWDSQAIKSSVGKSAASLYQLDLLCFSFSVKAFFFVIPVPLHFNSNCMYWKEKSSCEKAFSWFGCFSICSELKRKCSSEYNTKL